MCACACAVGGLLACWSAVENEPCTNSEAQYLQGLIWICSCASSLAGLLTLSCSHVNAAQQMLWARWAWPLHKMWILQWACVFKTHQQPFPLAPCYLCNVPLSLLLLGLIEERREMALQSQWGSSCLCPSKSEAGHLKIAQGRVRGGSCPEAGYSTLNTPQFQPPLRSIGDGYYFKACTTPTQIKLLPLFPPQQYQERKAFLSVALCCFSFLPHFFLQHLLT